ncbi:MAG: response regulator [Planctomycetes bacterium]|jgi:chemotaxis methyl-accepting protein methylase/chemotaxis response regulator CheB/signal transduction histidine kinase|nr:response regulator [Planctomycetota bacterium]
MTQPLTNTSTEATRVVGIGASAGGLDALKEFFGAMPDDSGMAFVVIQHLDPAHESRMAEILAKSTTMKVVQADDGMAVEPNCVYTYPPGRPLSIRQGRLVLGKPTEGAHIEAAIDHFLASLAEDQGNRAICIILSGSSGSDGPQGVRAVRTAGGMCMAQEPGSAQFAAMPQAVIDTGLADFVLAPAEMPGPLLDFAHHQEMFAAGREESGGEPAPLDIDTILKLLRTRTNSDYSHYKRTTVFRRIQRRMGLRQIEGTADYVKLLQTDAAELAQLAKDMLIGVSSFFRDAEAFDALRSEIIIPLIGARKDDSPLRVWVAGCATGEEAYSISMLLLEERAAAAKSFPVQVFATDVDERSLETARAGMYPPEIANHVSSDRLERFFAVDDRGYHVEKHLRETVTFSRHNLLADPPFSKLDLISCRNVLIYLEPAAQKKVLSVFSFALNVGGHLMLGKSEGVAGMEDLFEPISKQDRIFRLTRSNRKAASDFPLYAAGRRAWPAEPGRAAGEADILPQANLEAILRHFDATVLLIDHEGKILHFHGRTEKYLGHPKGLASLNILDMTGGMLSAKLRRAINRALQQDEPIHLAQIPLPLEHSPVANLTLIPVGDRTGGKLLAVIFEDAQPPPREVTTHPVAEEDEPLVAQLEAETKALRTELRTNVEGYDAAAEELKAANEEVMSMNEELQSANEELEASKEELQSVNEELTTVNAQLNEKVGELTGVNNDLANLLMVTEIATVFLDTHLQIRRFTPRAKQLLNIIDSDLGRPVGHITQNFTGVDLVEDSGNVLKTLTPVEKEVQACDGQWYILRILPYRTLDDRIDGVVVTFFDVTRLKMLEQKRRELEGRVLHAQKLESLGVMAGGIAHDFNNILTVTLGNLELLMGEIQGGTRIHQYTEDIYRSVLQAAELTGQMLAYSGRGVVSLCSLSLNTVVQEMHSLLEASISKQVSLQCRLDTALPPVKADAAQLRQVVLNLVINASEAMSEGGGPITVTTSVRHFSSQELAPLAAVTDLPDGRYVVLEVADNGCGMDSATRAKVFEPFYTTKFTGRGLGLASVAGIIENHHGTVSVQSELGVGSVFSVILPVDVSPTPRPEPPAEGVTRLPKGGGTILVIDDEESVRKISTRFLEKAGFTVLAASAGEEGLEIFKVKHAEIRCVVLDVTMPGIGTKDIMVALRAIEPTIPVVLCSGYNKENLTRRFSEDDISCFVTKPFTMAALLSGVSSCLQ